MAECRTKRPGSTRAAAALMTMLVLLAAGIARAEEPPIPAPAPPVPAAEAPIPAADAPIPAAATADDVPAAAKAEADTVWQQRCITCHGALGKGDGAAAVALTPKPRDLTLASWQTSVTDAHIEKIIAEGGQGVGLSMLMPANPDLVAKPDIIKALRARVRALGAQ
ncbi:MAG: cytochrome c [Candidatus Binatia bacterium]